MRAAAPRAERFPWLVTLLALLVLAILLGLGTWQVQRLHWKESLLASIEERTRSPALPFAEVESLYERTGDVDYLPVTATGKFHHAGERHFLATWKGQSGFFVYTPFELTTGGLVFVNRGFVPYDRKSASTRPEGQVEGEVSITGLARNPLTGKPSWIIPNNDLQKNVFYWKDRDAMTRSAGLRSAERFFPIFIDADATPNAGGLPVGGVTLVEMPNSHLQYAVTWYGLAAALVGVFAAWLWKRRNPPPSSPSS